MTTVIKYYKQRGQKIKVCKVWQYATSCLCCRPENRPCSRAHFHHTHFIIRWHAIISSPSFHHAIIMPASCNLELMHFIIRWQRFAGGVRGGGLGGWVGGMITFSTTYIMPLYHHHHIITQSSCHHHAISNLRISSYVDRDTRGVGGWVGGGDSNMYIRMWQWRHWHSSQHASLLTLTSKALSKKRNE